MDFPKKIILLFFVTLSFFCKAQTNYTFVATAPAGAFVANTAPVVPIYSSCETDNYSSVSSPIGFSFTFNCNTYTKFTASTSGYLLLGNGANIGPTSDFASNSFDASLGYGPIIAPLWDPNLGTDCTGGAVNYKLTGVSPNQILTIEFLKMDWGFSAISPTLSFQVKLYQTTNVIKFIYKQIAASSSPNGATIGIGGGAAAGDYYSLNGTGGAPTANYGVLTNNLTVDPVSNQTYTFTPNAPVAMSYTSSTTTQTVTGGVYQGSTNQQIIGMQVVEGGGCSTAQNLTQFLINMTGSTAPLTDVTKVHIYYTGGSSTFAATNEFATAGGTAPAVGTMTFNGAQTLNFGTNYFWVAYDVSAAAVGGDVLDAQCTQLTVSAVNKVPTITNPAGNRPIMAPPGGVGGPSVWFEANTNVAPAVNGSTVTNWNSPASDIKLVQTNAGIGPIYSSVASANAANYNPSVTYTENAPTGTFNVEALDNSTTDATQPLAQTAFVVEQLSPVIGGYVGIVHQFSDDNFDLGREQAYTRGRYSEHEGGNDFSDAAAETYTDGVQTLYHNYYWALCRVTRSAVATYNKFQIGEQDPGHADSVSGGFGRHSLGNIAETVFYPTALSAANINKIESYLSVKYGLTLGDNGAAATQYTSPTGTVIWASGTGYHNNVTGIAQDVAAEGLSQPKSQTTGNPMIDPIVMANSNFAAPTAMSANGQYFIWGHNGLGLAATADALHSSLFTIPVGTKIYNHGGPVTAIFDQIARVWRVQKTGAPAGNVIIAVDMTQIMGPTGLGTNQNQYILLLVDDNTNFGDASAGEYTISPTAGYPATGGIIYFSVPYSDFGAVSYFTIASTNQAKAPLPITLLNFNGACNNGNVALNWSTASETNNNYFSIERTTNGTDWKTIGTVKGAGTSTQQKNYFFNDNNTNGTFYYRLCQTDFDGTTQCFNTIAVSCDNNSTKDWNIYPNPSNGKFTLQLSGGMEKDIQNIQIYNVLGQTIFSISAANNVIQPSESIDLSAYAKGIYFIKIQTALKTDAKKIIFQ